MAVDKVEPPQTAVLPFAKGIVHYGETPQHLNIICIIKIIMIHSHDHFHCMSNVMMINHQKHHHHHDETFATRQLNYQCQQQNIKSCLHFHNFLAAVPIQSTHASKHSTFSLFHFSLSLQSSSTRSPSGGGWLTSKHFHFHNLPPPQSSRTRPPSRGGGWWQPRTQQREWPGPSTDEDNDVDGDLRDKAKKKDKKKGITCATKRV